MPNNRQATAGARTENIAENNRPAALNMDETQEMTEDEQGTIENVELYSAVCDGHVLEMIHVIQKYRHFAKKAWEDFVEIFMDHDNPTDVSAILRDLRRRT
jgi:hypothetical protein